MILEHATSTQLPKLQFTLFTPPYSHYIPSTMAEISGLPAADTQPSSAIPLPSLSLPELTTPSTPSLTTLQSWLPLYTSSLSKADSTLTRLSSILSTPSGTDTVLLTLAYTTILSSNILSKISFLRLKHTAKEILLAASKLPPNTTVLISGSIPVSRLALLATRLKALSVLIGDFRIFARLFGLLGIYSWGKETWQNEGKEGDKVLRTVAWAQVVVNALFQVLENAAYLSSKGVLGLSVEKQNKAWVWSSRYWMSHVLLDFVRMGRERSLRLAKGKVGEKGVEESDTVRIEEGAWREGWMRQLVVNTAWLPLTAHWSTETGLVSEFWVGVFGSVAGVTGLRKRWRDAAI